jgi:hypothetical protein
VDRIASAEPAPGATDAVDCAACHAVSLTDPAVANGMRGPHADCPGAPHGCAKDPSLATAANCRSCHELAGPFDRRLTAGPPAGSAGDGRFGMFTTFSELALARGSTGGSPGSGEGANCLDCHMAAPMGAAGPRNHALDGADSRRALRHAIAARLETAWADEELQIVVSLTNTGGGHHVPTGLPDRRLEVDVAATDADGRVIERKQWWLGRVLAADGSDEPVPFFVATRSISDNRLAAGQTRRFRLVADRRRAARVTATVWYHPLDPAIASYLGVTPKRVDVLTLEKPLP